MDSGAELIELDQEHRQLFGKPLPNAKTIIKEYLDAASKATKAGKAEPTLREFTEQKFEFQARREETGAVSANMTKKELEDYVKRQVEERLIAERSKSLKPNMDIDTPDGSPILRHRSKLGARTEEQITHRNELRGVEAAINDPAWAHHR